MLPLLIYLHAASVMIAIGVPLSVGASNTSFHSLPPFEGTYINGLNVFGMVDFFVLIITTALGRMHAVRCSVALVGVLRGT